MPVTRTQTTLNGTLASPWSAVQMADAFEAQFIAGGLMTAWHAAFTSGSVINRVLKIEYDSTKTLGTTYYWWKFLGADVYVHLATNWPAGATAPTGSQYLDFVSAATNNTDGHLRFEILNNTSTANLVCWRSQANPNFAWFRLGNGTTRFDFHITKVAPQASWVDLSKVMYQGMFWCDAAVGNQSASIAFRKYPLCLRKTHIGGSGLRSTTSSFTPYGAVSGAPWGAGNQSGLAPAMASPRYHFIGNSGNNTFAQNCDFRGTGIQMPLGFANANPLESPDRNPVFTAGVPIDPIISSAVLPSDFGIAAYYNSNTMTELETYVVSPGVEEWQMIRLVNNTSEGQPQGAASPLFMAKMVG